jgi:hypothetical protein
MKNDRERVSSYAPSTSMLFSMLLNIRNEKHRNGSLLLKAAAHAYHVKRGALEKP